MVLTKLHLDFFEILKIEILTIYFFIFINMGPIGVHILKRYSSYKSQPRVFKLVLNFPLNGPHKNGLGISEILSFRFLTHLFLRNFKFTIVPYGKLKTSILWKTSDRRAKRSEI